jgi:hypothetical protein
MDDPDVADAMILELFENSMDPLLSALHPGCKKNGRFSNMRVTRDNISRAVAPLFARIAMVFSGWNKVYHRRYPTEDIDLPDWRHAKTIENRLSLK